MSVQQLVPSEAGGNAEPLPPVEWHEILVPLTQLRPFEQNPRQINENQFKKLIQSLIEDGYHSRIKVTNDYRVIGGHQRLRAMQELGWTELKVLVPDRDLSDEQFTRILLRDNHNNGQWDMDMLANLFDLEWLRSDIGLHDIMGIPPAEDEQPKPSGQVCCPACQATFPIKGNKIT